MHMVIFSTEYQASTIVRCESLNNQPTKWAQKLTAQDEVELWVYQGACLTPSYILIKIGFKPLWSSVSGAVPIPTSPLWWMHLHACDLVQVTQMGPWWSRLQRHRFYSVCYSATEYHQQLLKVKILKNTTSSLSEGRRCWWNSVTVMEHFPPCVRLKVKSLPLAELESPRTHSYLEQSLGSSFHWQAT